MKHFFVIDNALTARGEIFNSKPFDTLEQATKEADKQWNYLTESEQKRRDEFYIALAEVDEDGDIIFDSIEVIREYK